MRGRSANGSSRIVSGLLQGAATGLAALMLVGPFTLFSPQEAEANADDYRRHVACNEAWRASPAATLQQCKLRSVHWDSFLWSMRNEWKIITPNNNHLEKQMEHSKCWVHVECGHGAPLFAQGEHLGKINYTEVRKLRRCRSNPSVVNSSCEPLTMAEIHQVSQSTSGNHRLKVSNVVVTEGGYATFRIKLGKPVDFGIRYYYFTRAGTAESGEDYRHQSGTVYIPPGHWSRSVRVKTESDYANEGDEHFFFDLKSLRTLGRKLGTYTWVYDPGAGLPQNLTVRATIRNKVSSPQGSSGGGYCHPRLRAAGHC